MHNKTMLPPVIFIGMHRSGTSMITRILESLGLFVGFRKDRNNEARFFRSLNDWLMSQCGARWDNPTAIQYLWRNENVLRLSEQYVRYLLNSPRAINFLGTKLYARYRGLTRINIPWGWKDPRNTFTLPFWLRIFPDANIILLERHGVDVAQSLRVRSQEGLLRTTRRYSKFRLLNILRPKRSGFIESHRCAFLNGGFSLWKEYFDEAHQVVETLPSHCVLKLRYEEVLADPLRLLSEAVDFCKLKVSPMPIAETASNINTQRKYAYRKSKELLNFAKQHKYDLQARKYTYT